MISKIKKCLGNNVAALIFFAFAAICGTFLVCGTPSEDGSITLDGSNAKIEQSTLDFIEDSQAALARLMNQDAPTDEQTISENDEEATGQGFYVTIDDILSRRLTPGASPYQCSRYTAYLATGKSIYSTAHLDYGPVNGKDVASWLVKNYGFKYIDHPVKGAIGSGGFNTTYGHTALYLYSTGTNTAMVEDANYTPLAVSTHNMNIGGWVWVVPGNYEPQTEAQPTQAPVASVQTPTTETTATGSNPVSYDSCRSINVRAGDTMGSIMQHCKGYVQYGEAMNNYASLWSSTKVKPGQSVYSGWHSLTGIGLYAGDVIEYRGE